MPEFDDAIISVDRLKIRVVRKTVNGIGANSELLMPLMRDLEAIECIAFDMPGIGESESTFLPMRFKALSKLSAKVLDHFDYGKVDTLGVSWVWSGTRVR